MNTLQIYTTLRNVLRSRVSSCQKSCPLTLCQDLSSSRSLSIRTCTPIPVAIRLPSTSIRDPRAAITSTHRDLPAGPSYTTRPPAELHYVELHTSYAARFHHRRVWTLLLLFLLCRNSRNESCPVYQPGHYGGARPARGDNFHTGVRAARWKWAWRKRHQRRAVL